MTITVSLSCYCLDRKVQYIVIVPHIDAAQHFQCSFCISNRNQKAWTFRQEEVNEYTNDRRY